MTRLLDDDRLFGRVLLGVALLGAVAGVLGTVLAQLLVGQVQSALGATLALSDDSLEAVDASLEVARRTVGVLATGVGDIQETSAALLDALDGTETLLSSAAEFTRDDLADSLESVEQGLPALIQVAATIDRTLSALALLPFGPAYDPDEPFDRSLQRIQDSLQDLPAELRRQAELIDDAAGNLGAVGRGVVGLLTDLADLDRELRDAVALLEDYDSTAREGRALIASTADGLDRQGLLTRLVTLLLGVAFVGGQLVPWRMGRRLLDGAG